MRVIPDQARLTLSLSGRNDQSLTIEFKVHEVPSGPASPYLAIEALGIPRIGDQHPARGGVFVSDVTAEYQTTAGDGSGEIYTVTVMYSPAGGSRRTTAVPDADPGIIEIGASVTRGTTRRDVNGDLMIVSYIDNTPTQTGGDQQVTKRQVAEAEIDVAQIVLSRSRIESRAPIDVAARFVGRVNRHPIWGFPARSMKCTRVQGVSDDGGTTYEVRYEFQYNPDLWDAVLYYIDDRTGRTPDDVVPGEGIRTFQVLKTEDFSRLRLPAF